jgi:hypothetical protein
MQVVTLDNDCKVVSKFQNNRWRSFGDNLLGTTYYEQSHIYVFNYVFLNWTLPLTVGKKPILLGPIGTATTDYLLSVGSNRVGFSRGLDTESIHWNMILDKN